MKTFFFLKYFGLFKYTKNADPIVGKENAAEYGFGEFVFVVFKNLCKFPCFSLSIGFIFQCSKRYPPAIGAVILCVSLSRFVFFQGYEKSLRHQLLIVFPMFL